MKIELVFAYGSNRDLAQMRERCPNSSLSPFAAEARGWKLCFPRESKKRNGGVGSVVRAEDSSVWGVVFAVSDRDLIRLDRFEGVGTQAYRREMIELRDLNGHPANAWTYFANAEGIGECVPHRDYIDLYIRGAEHFALPEDYVRTLREIRAGAKLD